MRDILRNLPRQSLTALVRGYRLLFSAWLGPSCRFEPTCSSYALQALERHGAAAGSYLALRRLARCHPWCEAGYDPVPDEAPALFRSLIMRSARRAGAPSRLPDQPTP